MQGCIVQIIPILFSHFEGQIACFHFLAITWSAEKNILFLYFFGPMYLSGTSKHIKVKLLIIGYTWINFTRFCQIAFCSG